MGPLVVCEVVALVVCGQWSARFTNLVPSIRIAVQVEQVPSSSFLVLPGRFP